MLSNEGAKGADPGSVVTLGVLINAELFLLQPWPMF